MEISLEHTLKKTLPIIWDSVSPNLGERGLDNYCYSTHWYSDDIFFMLARESAQFLMIDWIHGNSFITDTYPTLPDAVVPFRRKHGPSSHSTHLGLFPVVWPIAVISSSFSSAFSFPRSEPRNAIHGFAHVPADGRMTFCTISLPLEGQQMCTLQSSKGFRREEHFSSCTCLDYSVAEGTGKGNCSYINFQAGPTHVTLFWYRNDFWFNFVHFWVVLVESESAIPSFKGRNVKFSVSAVSVFLFVISISTSVSL